MHYRTNLSYFLLESSERHPDWDALRFEGGRYTFRELNERVNQLAHSLGRIGISKGEHIGLFSTNCHQCVEVLFAAAKVGAVLFSFNYRLKEEEVRRLFDHSEVTTLFFCERYWEMIDSLKASVAVIKNFICFERGADDFLSYEEVIADGSEIEPEMKVGGEDTALVLYTSGTTDFPKGVMLSHSHLVTRVLTRDMDIYKVPEGGLSLLAVPHFHTAGIQLILKSIRRPMTLIIMRLFDTQTFFEMVSREKVETCTLVPTMIRRIIDFPDRDRYDLSTLRQIRYGSAPMPSDLLLEAMKVFSKCSFSQGYGMTEGSATSLTVTDHQLGDRPEECERKLKRLSSVGRAIKDVEIKVVDTDGTRLPSGMIGRILIRGPAIMTGYWKDSKASQEVVKEGWLYTGDLGFLDEDGYLFLAGREKDIIIRGGENIAPMEVEGVLESHPEVAEAAVIGVPDPEWGELVTAMVVRREGGNVTEEKILDFCSQKLASHKRPESVLFVDSLPRNPLGKVERRALWDLFKKGKASEC